MLLHVLYYKGGVMLLHVITGTWTAASQLPERFSAPLFLLLGQTIYIYMIRRNYITIYFIRDLDAYITAISVFIL